MACEGNMPSFKYVTVENLVIVYNGTPYPIKTFVTNKKYIIWNINRPYQLEDSDVRPDSSLLEYLIVMNDKGKPTIVKHEELLYSFDQTTNGSNLTGSTEYNTLKTEVKDNSKKFNLISNTVDGMSQIIGTTEELKDGSVIYNLNKVKSDSKSYGISIGEIQTKIDDKYIEIKPIVLNNLIEYLRSASEYKLSFTDILEDTLITAEELALINTNKTNIINKFNQLQTTLSDLKAIIDSVEDVEKSQLIVAAKAKLTTLHNVLITICDSYLQDSKISGEEKTNIIQKTYELITYIGVVQNTCSNITVNGQAGVVYSIENELLMLKDSTTSTIKELTRNTTNLSTTVTTQTSDISQMKNSIALKVEQTQVNESMATAVTEANQFTTAQILEVNNNISSFTTDLSGITGRVESVESKTTTIGNGVVDHEERIKFAELKIKDDSIISTVTNSQEWESASGGINLIPNPTASLSLDGWGGTESCIITRYTKTGDIYMPPPTNSPSVIPDDMYYPELHLIEPYGGGLAMLLIDCSGKVLFFDGGYSQNAQHCIDYMKSLGIKKINYYIITHSHSDHAEASAAILQEFGADFAMIKESNWSKLPTMEIEWRTQEIYQQFVSKCNELNVKILNPKIDTYVKLSEFSNIKVFNSDSTNHSDYNHQSLMFLYTYKNNKIFLAGDGTHDASLSAIGQIGNVDFLQLGHHGDGSIGGSSQQLIDELKPKYSYFASNFLANGMPYNSDLSLMRVSWWYSVSFSHGEGYNGDFKFVFDGDKAETNGKQTFANDMWYEREPGIWFWFKGDGYLAKNEWLAIAGYWYHFGEDYVMYRKKWKQDGTGTWFYLKEDGKMAISETISINGKEYIFDHNGACINP